MVMILSLILRRFPRFKLVKGLMIDNSATLPWD